MMHATMPSMIEPQCWVRSNTTWSHTGSANLKSTQARTASTTWMTDIQRWMTLSVHTSTSSSASRLMHSGTSGIGVMPAFHSAKPANSSSACGGRSATGASVGGSLATHDRR